MSDPRKMQLVERKQCIKMLRKYKVTYLGYCVEMLKYLSENSCFTIVNTVGVKGRISDEQIKYISEHEIEYKELEKKSDVCFLEEMFDKSDIVILYKFEYIIPQNFIEKYTFFNFHGGNLKTNRGAHAVVWSILNQEKQTCLTLYKLTGGIDVGIVIGEYYVDIERDDTPISLNEKLWLGIPGLLCSLIKYLNGTIKGKLITEGEYRRKIKEEDYTINIYADNFEKIIAKINSQVAYSGAVLWFEGTKYHVRYTHQQDIPEDCERIVEKKENECIVEEHGKRITMIIEEEKQDVNKEIKGSLR